MGKVWPPRLSMAEGLANAVSGRWLSALIAVAAAWLTAAAGLGNALDVSRLAAAEQEWLNQGGNVLVVQASSKDHPSIDVARCEQVNSLDGVVGAYAAQITDHSLTVLPGNRASEGQVSPGVFQFYGLPSPTTATVLAAPRTVEPLGLGVGDLIWTGDGVASVAIIESEAIPRTWWARG